MFIVYSSYLEEQPALDINPNLGEIRRGNMNNRRKLSTLVSCFTDLGFSPTYTRTFSW